jgi:uncharacterized protein (TIGR02145 family)
MHKSLFKQPLFYTTVLSLLALGLIIASYVFGWNPPTQPPPNGNITLQTGASPAGSTGYIQFNAGSGALGGDANLFWDNTNKRLGIGTTTPAGKLDVAGSLNITGSLSYLRLPNLTTAQRDALTPAPGMMIYNTTNNHLEYYNNNTWGLVTINGTNGVSCTTASDCVSGYCVDGYCCNTACGDSCDACNIAGALGTCTLQPSNYVCRASTNACDPAEYCTGSSATCPADTKITSVTFTYKGASVTYGTVVSSGKCWLDRNLGASQVATAYNDSLAYGDLFQWGRLSDGHQTRTSGTTSTLSSTDNPGHSNFILAPNSPSDWRSPQNDNLWQGVSGINNPCPSGWRIPTSAEWDAERASWSQQNYNGAFASPLKLTVGGSRFVSDGSLSSVGSTGYYWSSTVSGANASYLYFNSGSAGMASYPRAAGYSVRCLKN